MHLRNNNASLIFLIL